MKSPESHVREIADLVESSGAIIVGRVMSQACRIDEPSVFGAPYVFSRYEISVETSLFGPRVGATIPVLIRGTGRVVSSDGKSLQSYIEGFDPPKIGERFLLFLTKDQVENDAFMIREWGEGIFQLTEDGTIRSPWRELIGRGRTYLHARVENTKSIELIHQVAANIKR